MVCHTLPVLWSFLLTAWKVRIVFQSVVWQETNVLRCYGGFCRHILFSVEHNAVNDADPWMYWILSHVGFKTTWIPSSRHGTHISFGHKDMESSCPGNQMLFSPDIVSTLGYEARIRIRLYHEMLHGRVFTVSEIGNRSKKRPFWSCHKR